MHQGTFEIEASDTHSCWAELKDGQILIHRAPNLASEGGEVSLQWELDVLRNLLSWATQGSEVNTTFKGPLAHQIREHSKELGMTPEMFVWHAVKVFIEVGAEP